MTRPRSPRYGGRHQAKRREWKPYVEGLIAQPGTIDGRRATPGHVQCHAVICLEEVDGHGRRIIPGTPWDLGHTPDGARWTGPEHRRCNRTEPQFRFGYREKPTTTQPPQRQQL